MGFGIQWVGVPGVPQPHIILCFIPLSLYSLLYPLPYCFILCFNIIFLLFIIIFFSIPMESQGGLGLEGQSRGQQGALR